MTRLDPAAGQIRVASYNVHSCIGRDGRYDPARIARVLGEIDADVYGLQEVDARPRGRDFVDQFHFLAEETGLNAVAGPNIVEGRARYGNALLSRWPVVEHWLVDLSIDGAEPRGAISALLDGDGGLVRAVNTHLGTGRRERRRQLRRLRGALAGGSLPTVFLGDFNMWGRERRQLRRLGAPEGRALAPGTWPARFPLLSLDRVWAARGAGLREVSVHRSPLAVWASDHLPVVAVVEIGPAGGRA